MFITPGFIMTVEVTTVNDGSKEYWKRCSGPRYIGRLVDICRQVISNFDNQYFNIIRCRFVDNVTGSQWFSYESCQSINSRVDCIDQHKTRNVTSFLEIFIRLQLMIVLDWIRRKFQHKMKRILNTIHSKNSPLFTKNIAQINSGCGKKPSSALATDYQQPWTGHGWETWWTPVFIFCVNFPFIYWSLTFPSAHLISLLCVYHIIAVSVRESKRKQPDIQQRWWCEKHDERWYWVAWSCTIFIEMNLWMLWNT